MPNDATARQSHIEARLSHSLRLGLTVRRETLALDPQKSEMIKHDSTKSSPVAFQVPPSRRCWPPQTKPFCPWGRGVAASLLPLGWKGLEGLVQHGDYMVMGIWFQHDATLENGETMVDESGFNGDLGDIYRRITCVPNDVHLEML